MNTAEKNALTELLQVLEKHDEVLKKHSNFSYLSREVRDRLKWIDVSTKFKIGLGSSTSTNCIRAGQYGNIGLFGKEERRTISCSDNKEQPHNEWLYWLSFPTGAYIFDEDYPTELFDEFFDELKSYNFKYSDTMNHSLYFDEGTASKIHEDFPAILKKYQEIATEKSKEVKIRNLQLQLQKLQGDKDSK